MKFTLVQENPIIGDFSYNLSLVKEALKKSSSDLLVFSECFLTGYPPKDLLLSAPFLSQLEQAISDLLHLSREFSNTAILIGTPYQKKNRLYNAALFIKEGQILEKRFKQKLPEYDVFEEKRFFSVVDANQPIRYKGVSLGVLICEDGWDTSECSPTQALVSQGIDLLFNLSASPFSLTKHRKRLDCFKDKIKQTACPIIYVNQVGANTELIFDGRSFCLDNQAKLVSELPAFEPSLCSFFFDTQRLELCQTTTDQPLSTSYSEIELIYHALVCGIRDYFFKTGFKKVVLGLSGGIDSALTCALAVDALGSEHVMGLSMPSAYSSEGSLSDAKELADHLNISLIKVSIESLFDHYQSILPTVLNAKIRGVAYENTQARIRGTIVMAYANAYGALALATSNKSELAVGYSTLYGDMCGALMVLGDLTKTRVYELAHYIRSKNGSIPINSVTKLPSAELRPNQTDQDSLPDYAILDPIIEAVIENDMPYDELYQQFSKETVASVVKLIRISEHKRKQAPPVLRVTDKAFGIGRRIPIVKRLL